MYYLGNKLYVANSYGTTVSAINTTNNTLCSPETPATLLRFYSTNADARYGVNAIINITAEFDHDLKIGSSMTVTLDTGIQVALNQVSGKKISGNYLVAKDQHSDDLHVTTINTITVTDTLDRVTTDTALPT